MIKHIIIKGILTSILLIIIAQLFFYLTSRSNLSSETLAYIKPSLYAFLGICATGLPVYFYFSTCGRKVVKMLLLIAVSWIIFAFHMLLSAAITYTGLAKDIEFSLHNMGEYVFTFFALGAGIFSTICVPVALIIEKLFWNKSGKSNEGFGGHHAELK
jgi:hypothetical protein